MFTHILFYETRILQQILGSLVGGKLDYQREGHGFDSQQRLWFVALLLP